MAVRQGQVQGAGDFRKRPTRSRGHFIPCIPESHSPQPAAEVPPAVPAPAAEVELPEKEHPGSALEPELSPAEQTEKNFDPNLDTFLRGIQ